MTTPLRRLITAARVEESLSLKSSNPTSPRSNPRTPRGKKKSGSGSRRGSAALPAPSPALQQLITYFKKIAYTHSYIELVQPEETEWKGVLADAQQKGIPQPLLAELRQSEEQIPFCPVCCEYMVTLNAEDYEEHKNENSHSIYRQLKTDVPNLTTATVFLMRCLLYVCFMAILTTKALTERNTTESFMFISAITNQYNREQFRNVKNMTSTYEYITQVLCPSYVSGFLGWSGKFSSSNMPTFMDQSMVLSPLRLRQHRVHKQNSKSEEWEWLGDRIPSFSEAYMSHDPIFLDHGKKITSAFEKSINFTDYGTACTYSGKNGSVSQKFEVCGFTVRGIIQDVPYPPGGYIYDMKLPTIKDIVQKSIGVPDCTNVTQNYTRVIRKCTNVTAPFRSFRRCRNETQVFFKTVTSCTNRTQQQVLRSICEHELGDLRELPWLDEYTRVLFIEFAVGNFNHADPLFGMVTMMFEFTAEGHSYPSLKIIPFRHDFNTGNQLTIYEILLVAALGLRVIVLISDIVYAAHQRKIHSGRYCSMCILDANRNTWVKKNWYQCVCENKYDGMIGICGNCRQLTNPWGHSCMFYIFWDMAFLTLVANVALVVVSLAYKLTLNKAFDSRMSAWKAWAAAGKVEPFDFFMDFGPIQDRMGNVYLADAANVLLTYFGAYAYLRHIESVAKFLRLFKRGAFMLLTFTFTFGVAFVGFVMAFHISLGTKTDSFRTITKSMITTFRLLLVDASFDDFIAEEKWLINVLYISYGIGCVLVALNVFIAIVDSSYQEAIVQEPSTMINLSVQKLWYRIIRRSEWDGKNLAKVEHLERMSEKIQRGQRRKERTHQQREVRKEKKKAAKAEKMRLAAESTRMDI